MKLKNSINVNTVSVGTTPLLPISQALLGQRSDFRAVFDPTSFDHAWSAKNKENTDVYKNVLRNLKGNGVDMTLTNFGYVAGSGYDNGTLVFDGVDDGAHTPAFDLSKDWTIIGGWEFIPTGTHLGAGLLKPDSLYLYNRASGIIVFVNATSGGLSVDSKSVRAVCSDGRIYLNDWEEVVNSSPQRVLGSAQPLHIGANPEGTVFTPMNFRNLSIYNGQVLTKQQCIEAYDYLQTLSEDTVPFDPTSFDEAWTVRGMSNTSPTKETLNNLTGNGNDLTLFGFDYNASSGYGSGYLRFDGVKDGAKSMPFDMGKRWTVVGEWELGTVTENKAAGIIKPSSLFIYNYQAEILVFINSGSAGNRLSSYKSLRAVCSDGRMYTDDWTEIVSPYPKTILGSGDQLLIGVNGPGDNFTPMKFKNLAFYKDRVLTKEQAQLAYNTLQTL